MSKEESFNTLFDWIEHPYPKKGLNNNSKYKNLLKLDNVDIKNKNDESFQGSLINSISEALKSAYTIEPLVQLADNQKLDEKASNHNDSIITHIEVTKDCKYFYTLDSSNNLIKWDVNTKKTMKVVPLPFLNIDHIIYFTIIEPPYYKKTMQVITTNRNAYIYSDAERIMFKIENANPQDYTACTKILDIKTGRFYLVFGSFGQIQVWDPCEKSKGIHHTNKIKNIMSGFTFSELDLSVKNQNVKNQIAELENYEDSCRNGNFIAEFKMQMPILALDAYNTKVVAVTHNSKQACILLLDGLTLELITEKCSKTIGLVKNAFISRSIQDKNSINLVVVNVQDKMFFYNFDEGKEIDVKTSVLNEGCNLINIDKCDGVTLKQSGIIYHLSSSMKSIYAYDLYDFSKVFEFMFPTKLEMQSCYTVNANNDTQFIVENGNRIVEVELKNRSQTFFKTNYNVNYSIDKLLQTKHDKFIITIGNLTKSEKYDEKIFEEKIKENTEHQKYEGVVCVYDAETGIFVCYFKQHNALINDMVIDNERNHLITCCDKTCVHVWSLDSLPENITLVKRLDYLDNENQNEEDTLRFNENQNEKDKMDINYKKAISITEKSFHSFLIGCLHESYPNMLHYCSEESLLFFGCQIRPDSSNIKKQDSLYNILCWSMKNHQFLIKISNYFSMLTSMHYSPTCGFLFTGHENGHIQVFDGPNMIDNKKHKDILLSKDCKSSTKAADKVDCYTRHRSLNQRRYKYTTKDNNLDLYDKKRCAFGTLLSTLSTVKKNDSKLSYIFKAHTKKVNVIIEALKIQSLFSGSDDGIIYVWKITDLLVNKAILPVMQLSCINPGPVTSQAISDENSYLFSNDQTSSLYIWNTNNGAQLEDLNKQAFYGNRQKERTGEFNLFTPHKVCSMCTSYNKDFIYFAESLSFAAAKIELDNYYFSMNNYCESLTDDDYTMAQKYFSKNLKTENDLKIATEDSDVDEMISGKKDVQYLNISIKNQKSNSEIAPVETPTKQSGDNNILEKKEIIQLNKSDTEPKLKKNSKYNVINAVFSKENSIEKKKTAIRKEILNFKMSRPTHAIKKLNINKKFDIQKLNLPLLSTINTIVSNYNGHWLDYPTGANQIVNYFYAYGLCDNFFDIQIYNPILVASKFKQTSMTMHEYFSMKSCIDKIGYPKIDPVYKTHDPLLSSLQNNSSCFKEILVYLYESNYEYPLSGKALAELMVKDLHIVNCFQMKKALTEDPIMPETTLPKYQILDQDPIVWTKRDRYIRSANELGDKVKMGISIPICYYRLNSTVYLERGSGDSRRLQESFIKSPDYVFETPLKMLIILKYNQWRWHSIVHTLLFVFYSIGCGFSVVQFSDSDEVRFIVIPLTVCVLIPVFLELIGSDDKNVTRKCIAYIIFIMLFLCVLILSDVEHESTSFLRAAGLMVLTIIAINKLDTFNYLRHTIEMVRHVIVDIFPTTIFMIIFCFASALSTLELRKHIKNEDKISTFYVAYQIKWDYIFGNFVEPEDFTYYLWLFHMFFSFVLNLMASNVVISVIGETYGKLSEIKEILDNRTKCKIAQEMEHIYLGILKFKNCFVCNKKKQKNDKTLELNYIYVATHKETENDKIFEHEPETLEPRLIKIEESLARLEDLIIKQSEHQKGT